MRALIRDQLRAGKRPEEIRAYFVSKYGEWILLSPTPRGVGLLVWVLPGLGALAGLGGAAWALRRWTRRSTPPPDFPVPGATLARIRAAVAGGDLPGTLSAEELRHVEALQELELDHRGGKLSDRDYAELRALYEARAAAALTSSATPPRPTAQSDSVLVADRISQRNGPTRRFWRWAVSAVFLVGFGVAIGVFLSGAVRAREDGGSITGDALTGTVGAGARADSLDLRALLERGRQAMEAQDFSRASDLFTLALRQDPDEPTAHASLGLILLRGGHPDRALKAFDRALARAPSSPQALWGKGLVLDESMGRTAEAIRTWETLLAQDLSKEDREHVRSVIARARARMAGSALPVEAPSR
jgi:cytochrome c-type biogenesis protein CcmH